MTRADWQRIAEERLLAAQALLSARLWASAYYVSGYAVEGGLKSCILVRVVASPELLFQEGGNKYSAECWSHDIEKLLKLAGLEAAYKADVATNLVLGNNWLKAAKWNEKNRYLMKDQVEAEELYQAIADNSNGVMQWIRSRW